MKRIFKTEFQDYKIKKSDTIILAYLNNDLILTAQIDYHYHNDLNILRLNKWMCFVNTSSHDCLEKKLLSDIVAYIPTKNTITTCKNTLPARFHIIKNKIKIRLEIHFEIQVNNQWLSMFSIRQYEENYWIFSINGYMRNMCFMNGMIEYLKDKIHIKYFPQELVEWMKSQELADKLLNP